MNRISTSNTGFGVKSGSKTSSCPCGARSSVFIKLAAASSCCPFGCHDAGKLVKEGNWNSPHPQQKEVHLSKMNQAAQQNQKTKK